MSRMCAIRLTQDQLFSGGKRATHSRRRVERKQIRSSVFRYFVANDGA